MNTADNFCDIFRRLLTSGSYRAMAGVWLDWFEKLILLGNPDGPEGIEIRNPLVYTFGTAWRASTRDMIGDAECDLVKLGAVRAVSQIFRGTAQYVRELGLSPEAEEKLWSLVMQLWGDEDGQMMAKARELDSEAAGG